MIDGDRKALLLVTHQRIERREVEDVLRRRWPDLLVKNLEHEAPTVAMLATDAADLGRRRRGMEPLRVIIMPQRNRQIATPMIEPMPVLV